MIKPIVIAALTFDLCAAPRPLAPSVSPLCPTDNQYLGCTEPWVLAMAEGERAVRVFRLSPLDNVDVINVDLRYWVRYDGQIAGVEGVAREPLIVRVWPGESPLRPAAEVQVYEIHPESWGVLKVPLSKQLSGSVVVEVDPSWRDGQAIGIGACASQSAPAGSLYTCGSDGCRELRGDRGAPYPGIRAWGDGPSFVEEQALYPREGLTEFEPGDGECAEQRLGVACESDGDRVVCWPV